MAIRVYELSKKFRLTNKELVKILQDLGLNITSHVSVIPEDIVELVEKELSKIKENTNLKNATDSVKREEKKEMSTSAQNINQKKIKHTSGSAGKDLSLNKQKNNEENTIVLMPMSPSDIAEETGKPISEIIVTLLKQGIAATKNQILSEETVKKLADLYGLKVIPAKDKTIESEKDKLKSIAKVAEEGNWQERLPIIVVIGHVDHGKTTLLDFIRKTKIAAKEKGGITQHLGAYEVSIAQGNMVFLDTPGHEAFAMLRVRGLKAADIAILIVAADDGVMPQTIEAIRHAKSVGLPIIVAINKIDKVSPQQVEGVKQQLSQYDIVPEEWGGTTPIMPISAKLGTGVDELLEVIALQAQLMELKTNMSVPARGYILESKLEKGRGFVATVICQHGKLHVGDYFFAGNTSGRVSSLVDSYGNRLNKVNPSIPVRVAGFSDLPNAGDLFEVVSQAEYKKGPQVKSVDSIANSKIKKSIKEAGINLIIKTDNISSKEALLTAIEKLSPKIKQDFNIIHAGVGDITESDVILASETKSIIYGLHVKIQPNIYNIIQNQNVSVKHFDIIYKLLEDIEAVAEASKPIEYVTKKIGEGMVIKIFDIKGLGTIAGVSVKSGRFIRDGNVIIWRGKQKIAEGKIKSLQRERKTVKEVHSGFECALIVEQFSDWQIDDKIECYQEVPIQK